MLRSAGKLARVSGLVMVVACGFWGQPSAASQAPPRLGSTLPLSQQQEKTKASQPLKPTPRHVRGLPGTLAMDLSSGIPVIEAKIDDKPLKLVVDTGASWSLLRPEAVSRLGLETRESEQLKARDAAGEVRGVDAAHVEKLVLETDGAEGAPGKPIELGDFDLVVLDSAVVKAAGADGILGIPMLRRMVATFDFAAGTLELGGESLKEADDGRTLQVRATDGGLITIQGSFVAPEGEESADAARAASHTDPDSPRATLARGPQDGAAGAPRNLLLDTGFSGFLHLPEAAAKQLAATRPAGCAGVASTAHRQREFDRFELSHDLMVGRYRLRHPIASVFRDAKATGDGALGTGVLRHFTVTIDLPRRRVRLQAPQDVIQLEEMRRPQPPGQDTTSR